MDDHLQSSTRRIAFRAVLLLVPLVALALVAPRAIAWIRGRGDPTASVAEPPRDRPPTEEEIEAARSAERKLAKAEVHWESGTTLTPNESAPDASGERVRWFQGFGVSVESTPEGAEVRVDGNDVGTTPVVTSVQCEPGDEVRIEVRKPPLGAQERTTTCRKDQLVELSFELK